MSKKHSKQVLHSASRHWISIGVFVCLFAALLYKITLFDSKELSFLREKAELRSIRNKKIVYSRGDILDRNGKPLSVSTRVFTIYVDPMYYKNTADNASTISSMTGITSQEIISKVKKRVSSRYVVVKRNLEPSSAKKLKQANLDGVYFEEAFKRFYPASEITSQLVGYTNTEGNGIEGVELAFNDWLQKVESSTRKVVVDGRGRVIRDLDNLRSNLNKEDNRRDLTLSIDLRIQELAYHSLQKQVRKARAKYGSLLMVDPHSGEILALASYPSFNPNNRLGLSFSNVRNRIFTDAIEPGSTVKPFTVAAAISSGRFDKSSIVDTGKKRFFKIGNNTIFDTSSHGKVDLEQLIVKSSNIAAAKVGLDLGQDILVGFYQKLALNSNTGSYFPGESEGYIPYGKINQSQLATLSYGYGLRVTLAQIARSYSAFANGGYLVPLSLLQTKEPRVLEPVLDPKVAKQLREIMSLVTLDGGTAKRASIKGYSVAGKTGTVHKYYNGRYSRNKYTSLFVGMAPAKNPKVVAVVMIDEPSENRYYGGEVAAPVFSEVVGESLKLLHINPDV